MKVSRLKVPVGSRALTKKMNPSEGEFAAKLATSLEMRKLVQGIEINGFKEQSVRGLKRLLDLVEADVKVDEESAATERKAADVNAAHNKTVCGVAHGKSVCRDVACNRNEVMRSFRDLVTSYVGASISSSGKYKPPSSEDVNEIRFNSKAKATKTGSIIVRLEVENGTRRVDTIDIHSRAITLMSKPFATMTTTNGGDYIIGFAGTFFEIDTVRYPKLASEGYFVVACNVALAAVPGDVRVFEESRGVQDNVLYLRFGVLGTRGCKVFEIASTVRRTKPRRYRMGFNWATRTKLYNKLDEAFVFLCCWHSNRARRTLGSLTNVPREVAVLICNKILHR